MDWNPDLIDGLEGLSDMEKLMTGKKQTKFDKEVIRSRFLASNADWHIRQPLSYSFHVCTKPLSSLRRTSVHELQVNVPAEGCYLLLRTLELPLIGLQVPMLGQNLMLLAEDQEKEPSICCLYGYVYQDSPFLLPVNTVFVLKEPSLKACSPQDFVVVVGSPSDFIVIGHSHALSKDLEILGWRTESDNEGPTKFVSKWKLLGNNFFKTGKYSAAIDAYLFALQKTEIDTSIQLALHLNLSIAYLSSRCFESSVKHAAKALEIQPGNEKALYRAGKAYYQLGQYEHSKRAFEDLLHVNPLNKQASSEVARCIERLREAAGDVDIYKLHRTSLDTPSIPIDHADYVGSINILEEKRGVVANDNLPPGTLVLVEKAAAVFFSPLCSSELGFENLARSVIRIVRNNPNTLGKKIYRLSSGDKGTDEDRKLFCDPDTEVEPIVDVRRIFRILLRNVFDTCIYSEADFEPTSCQLYVSTSGFQHSCMSNCTFQAYNDIITVRTCSFIAKGEELTLRYIDNHVNFPKKLIFLDACGLKCDCTLCTLDRQESAHAHEHRQQLATIIFERLATNAFVPRKAIGSVSPIIRELEENYGRRTSLRLHFFLIYCQVTRIIEQSMGDWANKFSSYWEKGLESVGLSPEIMLSFIGNASPDLSQYALFPDLLFVYSALMAEKEFLCSRFDQLRKWIKVLVFLERVFRGGNMEMLKDRLEGFPMMPNLLSEFPV